MFEGTLIVCAGLGNPTNRAVERETNVVLQSVFPLRSLGAFVAQPRMDKRTQLRELTAIVTGIRERDTRRRRRAFYFVVSRCPSRSKVVSTGGPSN